MAKIWKKLLLIITIIACIVNVMMKLMQKISFADQVQSSADYVRTVSENEENIVENKVENVAN